MFLYLKLTGSGSHGFTEGHLFAGLGVVVWIVLVVWILPKLGVPT